MSAIDLASPDKSRRFAAVLAVATGLAVPAEGLRLYVYRDPPGILTACRGHTGPELRMGQRFTLPQCDKLMDADMRAAVATVEQCAPGLPEPVHAAFADAVFNLGPGIACSTQRSTAARMLKAGNLPAACAELTRWDKATVAGILVSLPGLKKRRAEERALCESAFQPLESMPHTPESQP